MSRNDCIFVPSFGRAMNISTVNLLRRHGCKKKIYVVCDDSDKDLEVYKEKFKKDCLVFSKRDYQWIDTIDNSESFAGVIYARYAIQDFAKRIGITHYLMIDDDVSDIAYRVYDNDGLKREYVDNIDYVIDAAFDFLDDADADALSFATGGQFIGGYGNKDVLKRFKRRVLQNLFCRTKRPLKFVGRMNEDIACFVLGNKLGGIYITSYMLAMHTAEEQVLSGGMTEYYTARGCFAKAFYPVVCAPDCVKVSCVGLKNPRPCHSTDARRMLPMILNEKWRRG